MLKGSLRLCCLIGFITTSVHGINFLSELIKSKPTKKQLKKDILSKEEYKYFFDIQHDLFKEVTNKSDILVHGKQTKCFKRVLENNIPKLYCYEENVIKNGNNVLCIFDKNKKLILVTDKIDFELFLKLGRYYDFNIYKWGLYGAGLYLLN